MGILKQFASYLYIKKDKKEPGEKKDIYLRMMYGMNRISILVFLIAMLIVLVRWLIKAL